MREQADVRHGVARCVEALRARRCGRCGSRRRARGRGRRRRCGRAPACASNFAPVAARKPSLPPVWSWCSWVLRICVIVQPRWRAVPEHSCQSSGSTASASPVSSRRSGNGNCARRSRARAARRSRRLPAVPAGSGSRGVPDPGRSGSASSPAASVVFADAVGAEAAAVTRQRVDARGFKSPRRDPRPRRRSGRLPRAACARRSTPTGPYLTALLQQLAHALVRDAQSGSSGFGWPSSLASTVMPWCAGRGASQLGDACADLRLDRPAGARSAIRAADVLRRRLERLLPQAEVAARFRRVEQSICAATAPGRVQLGGDAPAHALVALHPASPATAAASTGRARCAASRTRVVRDAPESHVAGAILDHAADARQRPSRFAAVSKPSCSMPADDSRPADHCAARRGTGPTRRMLASREPTMPGLPTRMPPTPRGTPPVAFWRDHRRLSDTPRHAPPAAATPALAVRPSSAREDHLRCSCHERAVDEPSASLAAGSARRSGCSTVAAISSTGSTT